MCIYLMTHSVGKLLFCINTICSTKQVIKHNKYVAMNIKREIIPLEYYNSQF